MKNTIYSFLIAIFFAFSVSAFTQTPPPPNGDGGNPSANGNTPVGGGAPIGGGLLILALLGAGYGAKKVYDANKKQLAE